MIEWPSLYGPTMLKKWDCVVPSRPFSVRKSVMDDGCSFAILVSGISSGVVIPDPRSDEKGEIQMQDDGNEKLRIRYLTERECMRLMGQKDEDIDRMFEVERSKTVRYRLAGNSIVVDVLEAIFKGIYIDNSFKECQERQVSLDAFQ